jgi:hypothetical protein
MSDEKPIIHRSTGPDRATQEADLARIGALDRMRWCEDCGTFFLIGQWDDHLRRLHGEP